MRLLITDNCKEQNYAHVIGRSPAQQQD